MTKINFNIHRCKGCGLCVPACPKNNIKLSEDTNELGHHFAQVIDEKQCTGCALCFQMCPDLVIEIEK